jgi:hypothetical protein
VDAELSQVVTMDGKINRVTVNTTQSYNYTPPLQKGEKRKNRKEKEKEKKKKKRTQVNVKLLLCMAAVGEVK